MPILFSFNLALAVLLLFWPAWFSCARLKLPAVNPFTIAMLVVLPVDLMKLIGGPIVLMGDDGLFDSGYQFAVLASNVFTVCQVLGTLTFFGLARALRFDRHLPMQGRTLSPRDLHRISLLFLLVFVLAFYLLASAEFGVANWIANPREGYQLHRMGEGHWFALAISALSVSMLASQLAKPTPSAILWRFPVFVALAYLLGSKAIILSFFVAMLTMLWFVRWKNLTLFIIIGTPAIFGLMLWNLYLAFADAFELQSILEYFNFYTNAADYYREYMNGKLPMFWGEIWLTSFAGYVPRALWPDKPIVYGIVIIVDYFYPGAADLTNTPAFGGAVEQFADFGFAGVIVSGLFGSFAIVTGVMSYLLFRRPGVDIRRVTIGSFVLILVQFVPAFGTFFSGPLYVVPLAIVILGLRILGSRKRRRVTAVPVGP